MNLNKMIKLQEQNIKFFANICVIVVRNGFGETISILDAKKITRNWLTLNNNDFFKRYGFNWVPPKWLQNRVRKGMGEPKDETNSRN